MSGFLPSMTIDSEVAVVLSVNVLTVEEDLSGRWTVNAAENVEQGRFSRAGRTDNSEHLPLWDGKRHVVQCLYLIFAFAVSFA